MRWFAFSMSFWRTFDRNVALGLGVDEERYSGRMFVISFAVPSKFGLLWHKRKEGRRKRRTVGYHNGVVPI